MLINMVISFLFLKFFYIIIFSLDFFIKFAKFIYINKKNEVYNNEKNIFNNFISNCSLFA